MASAARAARERRERPRVVRHDEQRAPEDRRQRHAREAVRVRHRDRGQDALVVAQAHRGEERRFVGTQVVSCHDDAAGRSRGAGGHLDDRRPRDPRRAHGPGSTAVRTNSASESGQLVRTAEQAGRADRRRGPSQLRRGRAGIEQRRSQARATDGQEGREECRTVRGGEGDEAIGLDRPGETTSQRPRERVQVPGARRAARRLDERTLGRARYEAVEATTGWGRVSWESGVAANPVPSQRLRAL